MNAAEQKRNARIAAMSDADLLNVIADSGELVSSEEIAFSDMQSRLVGGVIAQLSRKQRVWAEEVARRVVPLDSRDVPKGDPVVTPDVLRNLPKRPPGRL